jgi:type III restriction enzyme
MRQVVIENPIINSPFEEPTHHFKFDKDGITDQTVDARRVSQYFIPIAQPRKKTKDKQLTLGDWIEDRIKENELVNRIRSRVKLWREGDLDVNLELVRRGLAWWYRHYAPKDKKLERAEEEEARTAKRGLWADAEPIPPWEWRKGRRD